jgi:hypothetical protein
MSIIWKKSSRKVKNWANLRQKAIDIGSIEIIRTQLKIVIVPKKLLFPAFFRQMKKSNGVLPP